MLAPFQPQPARSRWSASGGWRLGEHDGTRRPLVRLVPPTDRVRRDLAACHRGAGRSRCERGRVSIRPRRG